MRQRVFRTACGYDDWNAAGILRGDPSGTRCWCVCPARRASKRGQAGALCAPDRQLIQCQQVQLLHNREGVQLRASAIPGQGALLY